MPTEQMSDFEPDELQLRYSEWKTLVEARRAHLEPEVREWLDDWQLWDLACSPMNDDERRRIRYGHYLGWFARTSQSEAQSK
jgi:hypothetical protein